MSENEETKISAPPAENPNDRAKRLTQAGFSTDYAARKGQPIATGVLEYFPLALLAVAEVSADGNAQHNPGEPLHWAREKSTDEANTAIRHFMQRGTFDKPSKQGLPPVRHLAKAAWRILALLQKEIEDDLDRASVIHPTAAACSACAAAGILRVGDRVDHATVHDRKNGEVVSIQCDGVFPIGVRWPGACFPATHYSAAELRSCITK